MILLTQEGRRTLPALYSTDGQGGDAVAHVKFFAPDSNWTWYAVEGGQHVRNEAGEVHTEPLTYSPKPGEIVADVLFFGLVDGFEKELGYFSLSELVRARGQLGLPIERDLHWQPKPLREIDPKRYV